MPSKGSARKCCLRVTISGSKEAATRSSEAFDGLIFALLLGVAVAYMILASQFNSFIHPDHDSDGASVQLVGRAARALGHAISL